MANKIVLIGRIFGNYEDFKSLLRSMTRTQLFEKAASIAAVSETFEMMTQDYEWEDESEIDFLLQFRDPLRIIADLWYHERKCTSGDVELCVWNACNNDDQIILTEYPRYTMYDEGI
jgi:hypothetical protein